MFEKNSSIYSLNEFVIKSGFTNSIYLLLISDYYKIS